MIPFGVTAIARISHAQSVLLFDASFFSVSLVKSTVRRAGTKRNSALIVGSFPITTMVGVCFVLLALELSTRGAPG